MSIIRQRAYSIDIVVFTLKLSRRWLDNLLSRHEIPGVFKGTQGVERRISTDGLVVIEACRMLNLELGVSLDRAAGIASSAFGPPGSDLPQFVTQSGLRVDFPLADIERRIFERLTEAVETVARPRRGRPRKNSGSPN